MRRLLPLLIAPWAACAGPDDEPPAPTAPPTVADVRALSFAGEVQLEPWGARDGVGWAIDGHLDFVYWDAPTDGTLVCRARWVLRGDLAPTEACAGCLGELGWDVVGDAPVEPPCDELPDRADLSFLLGDGDGGDLRDLRLAPMDLLRYVGYALTPEGLDADHVQGRFADGGLEAVGIAFVPGDGWLAAQGGLDAATLPWGIDDDRPMFVLYRDAADAGRPLRGSMRLASLWTLDLVGGRSVPAP